ncbi:MAG: DUF423 domain-containing protein [Methylocystaceae bacterium]|jgi:uncharacterized membrane protein YgdD (TMEM256/DUF423 family)|nr:DUF423 domain-containing protein [Methylocystaceae bacterium]NBT97008.1 DUF423 domain-containing protein [Methylocystaceae bacterium]
MNITKLIVFIAALHGAAGVGLAAAASHGADKMPLLGTASQFLMIHAACGLALAAFLCSVTLNGRLLVGIIISMQSGVSLFSADLISRAYLEGRLFPFAAPLGGSVTLFAWIALALWSLLHIRQKII